MKRILSAIGYIGLTGLLLALFTVGYVFYFMLWMVRLIRSLPRAITIGFPLLLLLALAAGAALITVPLPGSHGPVTIVVPRGSKVRTVADSLYEHKVIVSRTALRAWLKITRTARKIQAGKYTFAMRSSIVAAARTLALPAAPLDTAVTIPEGQTIEQTASRFARTLRLDSSSFVRLCFDSTLVDSLGLHGAGSLEGYLFPSTYRVSPRATCREVIGKMADAFNAAWRLLDSTNRGAPYRTRHEIVTLASIVEKEAAVEAERGRIASVFSNRLAIGEPLGADPTVRYALKKLNGPLTASDLATPSPYNTRRYKGLPPGPICSPGLASLAAAVSPMRTNELYFVAKWDGSGAHDFSVTNQEHTRKKLKIRSQNARRIRTKEDSCRQ